jgi:hypothetical protein
MPRATAFHRADVKRRKALYELSLEPDVIDKIKAILKFEGVAVADVEQLVTKIEQTFRTYNVTMLADYQENPARIVAALKQGLRLAEQMREWLSTLPESVRFDLKTPELETLPLRIKKRLAYWHEHKHAGRIAHGATALSLRQSLMSIVAEDIRDKHKRDRAVADILTPAAIKFPNEKKNRGRFTGTKRPK